VVGWCGTTAYGESGYVDAPERYSSWLVWMDLWEGSGDGARFRWTTTERCRPRIRRHHSIEEVAWASSSQDGCVAPSALTSGRHLNDAFISLVRMLSNVDTETRVVVVASRLP